jgi:deazaflavin-dependent oxidoreductase (nitroreductase family)
MNVTELDQNFQQPSGIEAFANRIMGWLARRGWSPGFMVDLEVAGRKSGKIFTTPVNVLDQDGARYLVCPRGIAGWVRNARVSGEVTLRRGGWSESYALTELEDAAKPALLAEYLVIYKGAVQRYFPVKAGSGAEAMVNHASHYPVFKADPIV